jgi:S-adenosylmethionine hydrolase
MGGALVLRHSASYFPRGTIHVAVVDPGVGSARRPLLVECGGQYFIGPDNGVLSLALANKLTERLVGLSDPTYHLRPTSATFHGRDIFAPVAAHLSLGIDPAAFGDPVDDYVRLGWPQVMKSEQNIDGEIVYTDRFGNLFTNIEEQILRSLPKDKLRISLGNVNIQGLAPNYTAGADGRFIALINSWGLLEIALYKDSAQRSCQARIGDRVRIRSD